MATIELTRDNLQATIDQNPILLIDFWADWCQPCKMFGPVFEKASEQHPDVAFAKCDTKAQPEVAAAFEVQSIPTLAVFRDGVLLFLQPGALPPAVLEELITKVKQLDMAEVRAALAAEGQAAGGPQDRPTAAQATGPVTSPPSASAPTGGPPPSGGQGPKVVTSPETGAGLADLADDFVLRRQGVTREFLAAARQAEGVVRRVLEMYEHVRAEVREHGAEGRERMRAERAGWDFEPGRDLAGLDPETRSELRAVLRAIDELLKD